MSAIEKHSDYYDEIIINKKERPMEISYYMDAESEFFDKCKYLKELEDIENNKLGKYGFIKKYDHIEKIIIGPSYYYVFDGKKDGKPVYKKHDTGQYELSDKLPSFLKVLRCIGIRDIKIPLLCFTTTLPDLSSHHNLRELIVPNNALMKIKNLPPYLTLLVCCSNLLKELPELPYSLEYLDCSNNHLTKISNLPEKLNYLDCSQNRLAEPIEPPNDTIEIIS